MAPVDSGGNSKEGPGYRRTECSLPEICGKVVSSGVPWGLPPHISALSCLCLSLQRGHTDRAEEEDGLQVLPLVPGECLPRAHVSAARFQGWGPVTRHALGLHPSAARVHLPSKALREQRRHCREQSVRRDRVAFLPAWLPGLEMDIVSLGKQRCIMQPRPGCFGHL